MEREVLMTGIGGQGIQLASQVLARAALAEGRQVQLFGSYSGMMRGGNTDTTLIVADGELDAPPTVDRAWAAVLVHPDFAGGVESRVGDDGIILRNATLFGRPSTSKASVLDIEATELAVAVGHVMTVSMVMVGALAAFSALVALESLIGALEASLPAYRTKHRALNETALSVGYQAMGTVVTPTAWAS